MIPLALYLYEDLLQCKLFQRKCKKGGFSFTGCVKWLKFIYKTTSIKLTKITEILHKPKIALNFNTMYNMKNRLWQIEKKIHFYHIREILNSSYQTVL